jgi:hypothetical protein
MSLEIEGRFTIRPLSWTRALLSDARRIDDDLVILSLSSETTAEVKEWAPFEAEAFHRCSYMTEHLRQGDTISFTEGKAFGRPGEPAGSPYYPRRRIASIISMSRERIGPVKERPPREGSWGPYELAVYSQHLMSVHGPRGSVL